MISETKLSVFLHLFLHFSRRPLETTQLHLLLFKTKWSRLIETRIKILLLKRVPNGWMWVKHWRNIFVCPFAWNEKVFRAITTKQQTTIQLWHRGPCKQTQALSDSFTRNIRMDLSSFHRELFVLLVGWRMENEPTDGWIRYDEEMKNSQYLEINVSVAY